MIARLTAALLTVGLLASTAHAAPEILNAFVLVKVGDDINTVVHKATVAMWTLAKQNPQGKIMCLAVKVSKEGAVDQYGNPLKEDRTLGLIVEVDLDEIRKYRSPEYLFKSSLSGKYALILDGQRREGVVDECNSLGNMNRTP